MATIVCKKCGCILNENVKFCNECGAAVIPTTPAAHEEKPRICPNCKIIIQPGRSYCTNCGTILYSKTSQSSSSEVKPTYSQNVGGASNHSDPIANIGVKSSDGFADISSSSARSDRRSDPSDKSPAAAQAFAYSNNPVRSSDPNTVSNARQTKSAQATTYTQQGYPVQAPQYVAQPNNGAAVNQDSQPAYVPPYESFRPTVSESGAVPSFSVDGRPPKAAYSEQKANAAGADMYSHSQQMPAYSQQPAAYANVSPYNAVPVSAQPRPSQTAQPVQSYSPMPAANNYPPIDYTQAINIKKEELMDTNTPQTKKNVYVDEYDEDIYDEDRPGKDSKYEPVSTWGFVGIMILASIPIIGWIFVLIWACGGCRKVNKRSYARAALIVTLINILITCLITYLLASLFGSVMQQVTSSFGDIVDLLSIV